MLDSGWNVRALQGAAPKVEFENTNALGTSKKYAHFKVPSGGHIFPAFDLNAALPADGRVHVDGKIEEPCHLRGHRSP